MGEGESGQLGAVEGKQRGSLVREVLASSQQQAGEAWTGGDENPEVGVPDGAVGEVD